MCWLAGDASVGFCPVDGSQRARICRNHTIKRIAATIPFIFNRTNRFFRTAAGIRSRVFDWRGMGASISPASPSSCKRSRIT